MLQFKKNAKHQTAKGTPGMKLVEFVPPVPHPLWKLCLQMGITDVIVKVNPELTDLHDPWKLETLKSIVERLAGEGLRVVGLEGDPFDMSPIKEYGVGGYPTRDAEESARSETIARYCELLDSMGTLGIKLLCYNFMVGKGWSRTGTREGRGGAAATCFSLSNTANPSSASLKLDADQVWANYEHFIKAVLPVAEKNGIRMGLHPDDPCLASLGGFARIFGSVEAYDRAYALYPSPSNAVTFCQANFKLMDSFKDSMPDPTQRLSEMIRHFGKRIAFVHVRDVEGSKEDFTELFHDQGDTNQFTLMKTYNELKINVFMRGDHVPEMAYDRILTPDGTPGYFTLGRLFANGYLKALLNGCA